MNKLFFGNLPTGTILFSSFKTIRCLSVSDVGAVYLCSEIDPPHSLVAMKILASKARLDEATAASFRRELDFSFRLQHPNIVRGHGFHHDDDFTAFTMEYVTGGTLADLIQRHKVFPEVMTVAIISQLCLGVQAIHKLGIIHRDIKPENILVSKEGELKIADFGIASANVSERASIDSITGTLDYLSPEYIEFGSFDQRTDLYALGVMLYEMLCGVKPFRGGPLLDDLVRRVTVQPTPPWQINRESCPSLGAVAMRALERDPEKRFASAEEMLNEITNIGTSLPPRDSGRLVRKLLNQEVLTPIL